MRVRFYMKAGIAVVFAALSCSCWDIVAEVTEKELVGSYRTGGELQMSMVLSSDNKLTLRCGQGGDAATGTWRVYRLTVIELDIPSRKSGDSCADFLPSLTGAVRTGNTLKIGVNANDGTWLFKD
ncbi:MAG TPA: hypothetical protein VH083_03890 [Myxococcales bacterium]|jgi:hypothetical protein|nr:hypothetical protein [Myxococcales bacterium]